VNSTDLKPYEFVTLRYIPDVVTGEFLNVGVVLYAKDGSFAGSRFQTRYSRLNQFNPRAAGRNLMRTLREMKTHISVLSKQLDGHESLAEYRGVSELARLTLATDDSSLQWSNESSGLCTDYDKELDSLFSRLVSYADDDRANERRTSDDVWKDFKRDLEARNWLRYFQSKQISSIDDSIEFQHSIKNGRWHCVQPLSFDVSTDAYIKEKAHKWLGRIASVSESNDEFCLYFLLAEPSDPALRKAYADAKSILQKAPVDVEIFGETDSEQLLGSLSAAIPPSNSNESETLH